MKEKEREQILRKLIDFEMPFSTALKQLDVEPVRLIHLLKELDYDKPFDGSMVKKKLIKMIGEHAEDKYATNL